MRFYLRRGTLRRDADFSVKLYASCSFLPYLVLTRIRALIGSTSTRMRRSACSPYVSPFLSSPFFSLSPSTYLLNVLTEYPNGAYMQWGLYAGLSVEVAVDLIVAISQCFILRGFETGIRKCVICFACSFACGADVSVSCLRPRFYWGFLDYAGRTMRSGC